ncbi:phenylalanine--tRNA ligase subunit beta [Marinicauda algicola]|uniref:Phenylalanine--tRNA ligase beta subunit n=1 Tax=Marinicauda algicola TaxID=2029849 RepID=A0A4S2H0T1_9PROT|nr:phenylalanine--tRNA ligase subunit beta [Marinicauda algicola]TGY88898.1 phenylalanine--tRNA ligase subunit beta [Marinicauda algicola]
MKFTLSWLKEHLDTDLSLAALADAMTMAGLEIEEIENPAEKLEDFSVAYVKDCKPHPDADRLRVCTVQTKDGEKTIVCGAPNARAGMWAIYAPLGTYIPGLDFSLDKTPRKIRGIESHGMLCSTKEIGAGEDHEGIADLKGEYQVGTPAAEALGMGDPVIDFEVTPNRADWLGVQGIARDLAAAGLGTLETGMVSPVKGTHECPIRIETEWPEACPVFAGRVIRGVKNGPSPDWLQQRLKAIGLRPINALVDITNYISYDRARPLHVYDVAKIGKTIRARKGRGEADRFEALDGREYVPAGHHCVIADEERCLGLGGVMGGEYSGCTDETTDVFVESAWFDPAITRITGRETGIDSDAKYRFERGVDPGFVVDGLELATRMIMTICGGEPSDVFKAGEIPAGPDPIDFDPSRVKRLLGIELEHERIVDILDRLGFEVDAKSTPWRVQPPSWRRDCTQGADLIEEIARIEGYDTLPTTPFRRPEGERFEAPATERQIRVRHARRAVALRGYQEAITWSFCHHDEAGLFGGAGEGLQLANPISSELDVMRPSALVHLLTSVQKSADKGLEDARYFEAGPIYLDDSPTGQKTVVAGVRRVIAPRDWRGGTAPDALDVKADAIAALEAAGAPVDNLQAAPGARDWWHPGRSGVLRLGPKMVLAEFGEIHPGVLKALDIEGRVLAFEVFLDAIPSAKKKALKTRPEFKAPDLMPLRRDFAFLLSTDTPADELLRAVKGADKALISEVRLFDRYEGPGVGEGQVSLAVEVVLQPTDKTLTDKEIEAVSDKVVKAAEKAGAKLRG